MKATDAMAERLFLAMAPLLEKDISLRCAQALLAVAINPGLSTSDYARRCQLSVTTMSRCLLDLGKNDRYGKPGFNLVSSRDNPHNRREREYFLTTVGEAMLGQILGRLR